MRKFTTWFMCLVLTVSSFGVPATALCVENDSDFDHEEAFVFPQSDEAAFEPEVVLVELNGGATEAAVKSALDSMGYYNVVSKATEGVLRIEFASSGEAEDAANRLLEQGVIVGAQPNYEYTLIEDEVAEDPAARDDGTVELGGNEANAAETQAIQPEYIEEELLATQATSVNDPRSGEQWGLGSSNIYAAWDLAKVNHSVTVAALDLGFDVTHVDLKDNIVDPYNSTNNTTVVTPVTSSEANRKHGTHVAGIIAGVANNGEGIAGVTYNANVMPVKVVDANGKAYTNDLLAAYDHVISKKASRNVRVINLSMGSDKVTSPDDIFVKKIAEAYNKGIVTVAAAGNKGAANNKEVPYHIYPADYPLIVSVINIGKSSNGGTELYHTSNYNFAGERTKDIAAPGASILSTIPNNSYGQLSGTSMAAPLVAGVLALEFAANPSLTATAAVERLYASATKHNGNDFDLEYGWGEVNAYEAVRAAKYGADAARLSVVRKEMAAQGIPNQVFIDVDGSVSHSDDICWLAENGISEGWNTSKGKEFRPYQNVTRADMAAFLYRLAVKWGLASNSWTPSATQRYVFNDVTSSTPHAREIWWLASMGISEGWSTRNGKVFRPYNSIARADMAAFIHRIALSAGISKTGTSLTFADVNSATPHEADIRWTSGVGISSGWYGTRGREFRPYLDTARADMAAFLHRLYNLQ